MSWSARKCPRTMYVMCMYYVSMCAVEDCIVTLNKALIYNNKLFSFCWLFLIRTMSFFVHCEENPVLVL